MYKNIFIGLMIPFLGTSLGAMLVLGMKNNLKKSTEKGLGGFAAGVMVAASIWSLIIPSLESSSHLGKLSFIPAAMGFWIGILFLLLLDKAIPHMHFMSGTIEGLSNKTLKRTTMLTLAVTIHNIPEGMAVGVLYAAWLNGEAGITLASALVLSIGIALQNFPEGAIISMPLRAEGFSIKKSCVYGILSGIVEPIAAFFTIIAANIFTIILPYMLSFAAGAMFYVVVEELIPEMSEGKHSNIGILSFSMGFTIMMILDITLG